MKLVGYLVGAAVLIAIGWFAHGRVMDAEERAWLDRRAELERQIAVGDLIREAAEFTRDSLRRRLDSLERAAVPLPSPRPPLPRPKPPAGNASDSSAFWKREATVARAEVDTLTAQLDTVSRENQRLSVVVSTLISRVALDSVEITRIASERDSALQLVKHAPVGQRRCRVPLIGIQCPTIVIGYGYQLQDEPDMTGKSRLVAHRGAQVTAGWDLLDLVGLSQ